MKPSSKGASLASKCIDIIAVKPGKRGGGLSDARPGKTFLPRVWAVLFKFYSILLDLVLVVGRTYHHIHMQSGMRLHSGVLWWGSDAKGSIFSLWTGIIFKSRFSITEGGTYEKGLKWNRWYLLCSKLSNASPGFLLQVALSGHQEERMVTLVGKLHYYVQRWVCMVKNPTTHLECGVLLCFKCRWCLAGGVLEKSLFFRTHAVGRKYTHSPADTMLEKWKNWSKEIHFNLIKRLLFLIMTSAHCSWLTCRDGS